MNHEHAIDASLFVPAQVTSQVTSLTWVHSPDPICMLGNRQMLGPETNCWRNWVGYAKYTTHRPFPGAYDDSFCRYWSPKHARS